MRKSIATSALVLCGACQVYTPVSLGPSASGNDVRVTLTDHGTLVLYGPLGTGARQVEGKIQGMTDSTLTLGVTQVTRLTGVEENWKGEQFTFNRNDIASVERRQTSVPRSVLAAGAIVGGAFLATRGTQGGDASGGPTGGPPQGGH